MSNTNEDGEAVEINMVDMSASELKESFDLDPASLEAREARERAAQQQKLKEENKNRQKIRQLTEEEKQRRETSSINDANAASQARVSRANNTSGKPAGYPTEYLDDKSGLISYGVLRDGVMVESYKEDVAGVDSLMPGEIVKVAPTSFVPVDMAILATGGGPDDPEGPATNSYGVFFDTRSWDKIINLKQMCKDPDKVDKQSTNALASARARKQFAKLQTQADFAKLKGQVSMLDPSKEDKLEITGTIEITAGLDDTYRYDIDYERDFVPRGAKLMAPNTGYFWGIVLYPKNRAKGLADRQRDFMIEWESENAQRNAADRERALAEGRNKKKKIDLLDISEDPNAPILPAEAPGEEYDQGEQLTNEAKEAPKDEAEVARANMYKTIALMVCAFLIVVGIIIGIAIAVTSGSESGSDNSASVPGAPSMDNTCGSLPGNYSVSLKWKSPTANGGNPVTGFEVKTYQCPTGGCSSQGSGGTLFRTETVAAAPSCTEITTMDSDTGLETTTSNLGVCCPAVSITGLSNEVTYYFTVAAVNTVGTGAAATSAADFIPRDWTAYALRSLENSLGGPWKHQGSGIPVNWTHSWYCDWDGVGCTLDNATAEWRVTSLSLSELAPYDTPNVKISGSIPSGIQYLSHLTDFNINNNAVGGTIPAEMAQLTAMRNLDLSQNCFYGILPELVTWDATSGYAGMTNILNFNLALNGNQFPVQCTSGCVEDRCADAFNNGFTSIPRTTGMDSFFNNCNGQTRNGNEQGSCNVQGNGFYSCLGELPYPDNAASCTGGAVPYNGCNTAATSPQTAFPSQSQAASCGTCAGITARL